MYINRKYLISKGLNALDMFSLGLILQNSSEDMTDDLREYLSDTDLRLYEDLGLVTSVKAKKKGDHEFSLLRLSKKGKEVYRNAQMVDFTIEEEKLLEYISNLYLGVEKPIGNEERVKQLLAWFRVETAYTRKLIFIAVRAFIESYKEAKKEQYIPSLENLLWKGNNIFATKWTLADSKLYQFIQEHKKELNANLQN